MDPLPKERPEEVFERVFGCMVPEGATPAFEVRFRPFASLRSEIRYHAGSGTIEVRVSDILQRAPPDVFEALAAILLARLYDEPASKRARRRYRRWTLAPETHRRILEVRRDRSKKDLLPPAGTVRDLDEIFDRLNAEHFNGQLRKPRLGWSPGTSRKRLGHYDEAHDAIVISRALDRPEPPLLALEYVLFHEMLHLEHGVRIGCGQRGAHPPEFIAAESRFPGIEEAQRILASFASSGAGGEPPSSPA